MNGIRGGAVGLGILVLELVACAPRASATQHPHPIPPMHSTGGVLPAPDPAPGEDLGITGRAYLPEQGLYHKPSRFSGRVTAVSGKPPVDREREWTVSVADAGGAVQTYLFVLPEVFALPMTVGASVEIRSGLSAGRAAPGVIVVMDPMGQLLVAIGQLPEAWRVEDGVELSVDEGREYDAHRHAVDIGAPRSTATLDERWRKVALEGAVFYGSGSSVRNVQHPGAIPPPGFQGGWTDLALIRVVEASH